MSDTCNHDCAHCGESNCDEKVTDSKQPESLLAKANKHSSVKKIIGVVSGKGGVGKSFVSSLLASLMQKKGFKTGILDSDITGPSIPKMFNVEKAADGVKDGVLPNRSKNDIQIISSQLLLDNPNDPIIWRGVMIADLVKQFWSNVIWENLDFLFIDMPPGTGDVALTVFQSLPVDGIIIVTSPQELVEMIVEKAVNMANMMNVPILGVVENMSYIECPKCQKKVKVFGESHLADIAKKHKLEILGQIPINSKYTKLCDEGKVEDIEMTELDRALTKLESLPLKIYNMVVPVNKSEDIVDNLEDAKTFNAYTIVKDMIIGIKKVDLQGTAMDFLMNDNVSGVICNNITKGNADKIEAKGIELYIESHGKASQVVRKYLEVKDNVQDEVKKTK